MKDHYCTPETLMMMVTKDNNNTAIQIPAHILPQKWTFERSELRSNERKKTARSNKRAGFKFDILFTNLNEHLNSEISDLIQKKDRRSRKFISFWKLGRSQIWSEWSDASLQPPMWSDLPFFQTFWTWSSGRFGFQKVVNYRFYEVQESFLPLGLPHPFVRSFWKRNPAVELRAVKLKCIAPLRFWWAITTFIFATSSSRRLRLGNS